MDKLPINWLVRFLPSTVPRILASSRLECHRRGRCKVNGHTAAPSKLAAGMIRINKSSGSFKQKNTKELDISCVYGVALALSDDAIMVKIKKARETPKNTQKNASKLYSDL